MPGSSRVGMSHVVRELRGGFVLRPGAISIALAATAIGLATLEERITPVRAWSDFLDRLFPPEPEAAHVVLGTIAGSMITVVAVVYSILPVVLTFASTQFSPRVLVAFVEDRVSQTTLGVFVGTFTDCLLTLPAEDVPDPIGHGVPVLATRSGYIRSVDESSLLAAARAADAAVCVDRAVGHFVIEGTSLFEVSPADRATDALRTAALRAFDIGPARTMVQDVEFGILQIVDIALKAISPAVNDPTTALTCIDQLGRILVRAAMRRPPISTLRDPDGRARVVLPRTSFPRLLDVAFSQIVHYGKAGVAVPLRMMRVLAELAAATRHRPYAQAIRDQARRLSDACTQGFPDADRDELNVRLAAVERAVAAVTAPNEAGASSRPDRPVQSFNWP